MIKIDLTCKTMNCDETFPVNSVTRNDLCSLGRISITLNSDWASPKNASDVVDVSAAERRVQFHLGW